MHRNSKWIIAAVLLLWYVLGVPNSIGRSGVVHNWRHPSPPPQAQPADDDRSKFMFQSSPAMRAAVERHVRLTAYPGSRLELNYWSGNENPYSSASLSTNAPMNDVVRFYSTQYAFRKPLYQRGKTPDGQSLLMFWQQPDATYLVMIKRQGRLRGLMRTHPRTVRETLTLYSLVRLSHPLKLVAGSPLPWELDKPLPPDKFGLPLPPGSRVDYCGWARGERGMMGMALAEVNSSGAQVGAFYRDFVRSGSFGTSGNTGQISWHGRPNSRHEVTYCQMDESLPTIVVLQHSGGQWWESLLPPM